MLVHQNLSKIDAGEAEILQKTWELLVVKTLVMFLNQGNFYPEIKLVHHAFQRFFCTV